MRKLLMLALALIVSVSALSQKVWYADNNTEPVEQTATYDGSKENPFPYRFAMAGADGRLTSSDTVLLLPGSYDPVKVTGVFQGTVTFKPAIPGTVVFYGGINQVGQGGVISVQGALNVALQGFKVFGNNPNRNQPIGELTGVSSGFNLKSGYNITIADNYIKDVTGSGIYLAADCKNIKILYNKIKYVGYRSYKRRHHHGLYLQCYDDATVLVQGNVITHPASYGVQVWQQSPPKDQRSKINNVTFIDNIMMQSENHVITYGGSNDTRNPVMINNSVFNSVSGLGIRVGHTPNGSDNDVFGTHLSGNYIGGNLQFVNPTADLVSIDNNVVVSGGESVMIHTYFENALPGLLAKMDNNLLVTRNTKPIRLVDDNWSNEQKKLLRNYNYTASLADLRTQGLPASNETALLTTVEPSLHIFPNPYANEIFVAIRNPQGLRSVPLDVSAYFDSDQTIRVYDFENYLDPIITAATTHDLVIDMDMPGIEPVFGNLDIDAKTDRRFACLIISGDSKQISRPDDTNPPQDDDTIQFYQASFTAQLKTINDVSWIDISTTPSVVGSVLLRPHGAANWITENSAPYTFMIKDGAIQGTTTQARGKVTFDVQLFSESKGSGLATLIETMNIDFEDTTGPIDDNPGDVENFELLNEKLTTLLNLIEQQTINVEELRGLIKVNEILIKKNAEMLKNHEVQIEIKKNY